MAEIHGRLGLCWPVTLPSEPAPKRHPGMLTPAPARLRPPKGPLTADAQPTDPFPTGPAASTTTTHDRLRWFTLTSSRSDDGIRRHP